MYYRFNHSLLFSINSTGIYENKSWFWALGLVFISFSFHVWQVQKLPLSLVTFELLSVWRDEVTKLYQTISGNIDLIFRYSYYEEILIIIIIIIIIIYLKSVVFHDTKFRSAVSYYTCSATHPRVCRYVAVHNYRALRDQLQLSGTQTLYIVICCL